MKHSRKIIYLAGFLFSLPVALVSYINSSFISSFVGEKFVSLVYVLGSICSILALFFAPKIFKKLGSYKFLLLAIFIDALSFLFLAFVKNAWSAVFIFVLGIAMNTLLIFSLDELLKIFSKDHDTGKTRGMYLTICNLAWIISQLIYGVILGEFYFRATYFIGFLIMVLFLVISFFSLKNTPDPDYDKVTSLKYVSRFFKNKNLIKAYMLSFLTQFFYCWMIVYTPIYLHAHLNFSWREIGIIFSIMLLPFLFVPFRVGRYADRFGERKFLVLGFFVTALSSILLFFVNAHSLSLWALLLFATRVGAATIETASDAYFFKHIKSENEELVGIYRNASPLAYVLGSIVAFIVFALVPSFNFIFLVLGTIMLLGIYLSSTIKKGDI